MKIGRRLLDATLALACVLSIALMLGPRDHPPATQDPTHVTPPLVPGQAEATGEISAARGGIVTADPRGPLAGASLEVPPGALTGTARVQIISGLDAPLPEGLEILHAGPTVKFKIEGARIQNRVRIGFPYPDADGDGLVDGTGLPASQLTVLYFHESSGRWTRVSPDAYPHRLDPGRRMLFIETPHLSRWRIAIFKWSEGTASEPRRYTYKVVNHPARLEDGATPEQIDEAVDAAVRIWDDALEGITFERVREGEADIDIGWSNRITTPREAIAFGLNGVKGYVGLVGPSTINLNGINGAWSPGTTRTIVGHEFGHVLGIVFHPETGAVSTPGLEESAVSLDPATAQDLWSKGYETVPDEAVRSGPLEILSPTHLGDFPYPTGNGKLYQLKARGGSHEYSWQIHGNFPRTRRGRPLLQAWPNGEVHVVVGVRPGTYSFDVRLMDRLTGQNEQKQFTLTILAPADTPLPPEEVEASIDVGDNELRLDWTPSAQADHYHAQVEFSEDGRHWQTILDRHDLAGVNHSLPLRGKGQYRAAVGACTATHASSPMTRSLMQGLTGKVKSNGAAPAGGWGSKHPLELVLGIGKQALDAATTPPSAGEHVSLTKGILEVIGGVDGNTSVPRRPGK